MSGQINAGTVDMADRIVEKDATKVKTEAKRRLFRALVGLAAPVVLLAAIAAWNPLGLYVWFKAFHVIAIIAWMAGMLYLPRLFVYHCTAKPGSEQSETFKIMERRLLRGIINPSMIVAWTLGLWMVYEGGWITAHWFHAKLLLVVTLSAIHGMLARWTADFAGDRNRHSQRFYRIVNEIPAVLMIGIVILVVVKPF
jgi:putative membrane protein